MGTRSVTDVELGCDDYARSLTKIDRNAKVAYDAFPAAEAMPIKNLNMGFIEVRPYRPNAAW